MLNLKRRMSKHSKKYGKFMAPKYVILLILIITVFS